MNKLNEEMKQKFKGRGTRRLPPWWVLPEISWWLQTDSEQLSEIDAYNEQIKNQQQSPHGDITPQELIAPDAGVAPVTAKKKKIKPVAFLYLFYPDGDSWALLTDEGRFLSMSFLVADLHILILSNSPL